MSAQIYALEITEGEGKGTKFRLTGDLVTIGRSKDCAIQLANGRGISRHHAEVTLENGAVLVRDLGSQNGTLVDGKKIDELALKPGAQVKVGSVVLKLLVAQGGGGSRAVAKAGSKDLAADPAGMPLDQVGAQPVGQALTYADTHQDGVQEVAAAVGSKAGQFLLMLLLILGLSLVGVYLYNIVETPLTEEGDFTLLAVGESKVVPFRRRSYSFRADSLGFHGTELFSIEQYVQNKGLLGRALVAVDQMSKTPKVDFLIMTGKSEGDGYLEFLNSGGEVISKHPVLVRGSHDNRRRSASEWAEMDEAEARRLANRHEDDGDVLLQDKHNYSAYVNYRKAIEILGRTGVDPDRVDRLWTKANQVQAILAEELASIFKIAMSRAYPESTRTQDPDFLGAFVKLNEAKLLIQDEDSIDWQVVHLWQRRIRRDYLRQKARQ